MIIYKRWDEKNSFGMLKARCEGWYLFGLIPLYVRRIVE